MLRNVSGAQINLEELDRELAPYVPMFRMGEDVVPSIQQRRHTLGLQFVDQAGNEFNPNRLSPLARRYCLRALTQGSQETTDQNPPQVPLPGNQPGVTVIPR